MTVEKIFETVAEKGWAEYRSGAFLQSAESLIAEQDGWGDEDSSKDADFSACPWWITTDDGTDPVPVMDQADFIREHLGWGIDIVAELSASPMAL
jgi:hypothetical protein